jgi:hypothetical protein
MTIIELTVQPWQYIAMRTNVLLMEQLTRSASIKQHTVANHMALLRIRSRKSRFFIVQVSECISICICINNNNNKGKGKGYFHPRTGHEGPEGE